ncbi:hypothetical protein [Streptomyces sp. NPDC005773]|uniref:hypothetical protein n=1 Tax=Streptomyces sp. NPDC005773 TaxID=3364727 RepID=UPI00369571F1
MLTGHTSTAVRTAAAGVGLATAPAHVVRGAVGEDRAVLTVDPPRRRELAVFSRVGPTGAGAAFTELLTVCRPPGTPGARTER